MFPPLSTSSLSTLSALAERITARHRPSISQAITLLESSLPQHRQQANELMRLLDELDRQRTAAEDAARSRQQPQPLPQHGHSRRRQLIIGVSGAPGVGKSTFIEKLGQWIVDGRVGSDRGSDGAASFSSQAAHDAAARPAVSPAAASSAAPPSPPSPTPSLSSATQSQSAGLHLAILTVDPSSHLTGGSILGDRTRMPLLSSHPAVYIRPSPSKLSLGGLHPATYDAVCLLSRYARYDVCIVETVGVGQSEVAVRDLSDVVLLLLAPAAGDELQAIKKGVVEVADLIVVNKADGPLLPSARHTFADYQQAAQLMAHAARVMLCSSTEESGQSVAAVWREVQAVDAEMEASGRKAARRAEGERRMLLEHAPDMLWSLLMSSSRGQAVLERVQRQLAIGELNVRVGAQRLVEEIVQSWLQEHGQAAATAAPEVAKPAA